MHFLAGARKEVRFPGAGCGLLVGSEVALAGGDAADAAVGVVLARCQLHVQRVQIRTDATQHVNRDAAAVA